MVIILVAISAYLFRLSFFVIFDRIDDVPEWGDRVLRYVAPAVLAALVFPQIMYIDGSVSLLNPRLIAGTVAGVVAWKTENLAVIVTVGMVVFWIVSGML